MTKDEVWQKIKNDETLIYNQSIFDVFLHVVEKLNINHFFELSEDEKKRLNETVIYNILKQLPSISTYNRKTIIDEISNLRNYKFEIYQTEDLIHSGLGHLSTNEFGSLIKLLKKSIENTDIRSVQNFLSYMFYYFPKLEDEKRNILYDAIKDQINKLSYKNILYIAEVMHKSKFGDTTKNLDEEAIYKFFSAVKDVIYKSDLRETIEILKKPTWFLLIKDFLNRDLLEEISKFDLLDIIKYYVYAHVQGQIDNSALREFVHFIGKNINKITVVMFQNYIDVLLEENYYNVNKIVKILMKYYDKKDLFEDVPDDYFR